MSIEIVNFGFGYIRLLEKITAVVVMLFDIFGRTNVKWKVETTL